MRSIEELTIRSVSASLYYVTPTQCGCERIVFCAGICFMQLTKHVQALLQSRKEECIEQMAGVAHITGRAHRSENVTRVRHGAHTRGNTHSVNVVKGGFIKTLLASPTLSTSSSVSTGI